MAAPLKPRPLRLRYHAVTVVAGAQACAQAKALKDVRLLSLEAPPRLPIAGCSNPGGCTCRFQHHADRRAGPRRSEMPRAMGTSGNALDNRRRLVGRRDSDHEY